MMRFQQACYMIFVDDAGDIDSGEGKEGLPLFGEVKYGN